MAPVADLPSASEQKTAIAHVHTDSEPLKPGQSYYLIPQSWWKQWSSYTGWDDATGSGHGTSAPPGAIDASVLLAAEQPAGEEAALLRDGIREVADFRVVGESAWTKLHGWYGGGPAVCRQAIAVGGHGSRIAEVQLELTLLKLCVHLESDREEHKALSAEVFELHVSCESTVQATLERMVSAWQLPGDKVRLWDYYNRRRYSLLSDTSKSLDELKMYSGQDVLIEVEQSQGGWRFSDEGTETSSSMDLFDGIGSSGSSASTGLGGGGGSGRRGRGGSADTIVDTSQPSHSGVVGLSNLGNTCFMNSMLQCLSNVSSLRTFFIEDKYLVDLNDNNPLGANGELANAFASLLKLMWGNGASTVSPRNFKHVLGRFAPQFAGYGQQDSQELCNYVLDVLHEDTNRVRNKPYVENFEPKGQEPDEDIAEEVKRRHKLRNNSQIADLFEGYFKSTVVCPVCDKVSVTFDSFMSVAVPLRPEDTRRISVTLRRYDGIFKILRVSVPLNGTIQHLLSAVVAEAGPPAMAPSALICAEVYGSKLHKLFGPASKLELIHDPDVIFVWEVRQSSGADGQAAEMMDTEATGASDASSTPMSTADSSADAGSLILVCPQRAPAGGGNFSHQYGKFMGLPLVLSVPYSISGELLHQMVASHLRCFQRNDDLPPHEEAPDVDAGATMASDGGRGVPGTATLGETAASTPSTFVPSASMASGPAPRSQQWRLHYTSMSVGQLGSDPLGAVIPRTNTACDFSKSASASAAGSSSSNYGSSSSISDGGAALDSKHVVIEWLPDAFGDSGSYDRSKVEAAQGGGDANHKYGIQAGHKPASERGGGGGVQLKQCLELFSREETLDADNAWYCPRCKEHREARKKIQFWTLPDVLVMQLKRFSAQGMWRRKNDTPVDFPFTIDLAPHVLHPSAHNADGSTTDEYMYDLIACSNHYGSTGGGHYTAFAKNSHTNSWYKFDDSHTSAVEDPSSIVTPAAYVLIYERRGSTAAPASTLSP